MITRRTLIALSFALYAPFTFAQVSEVFKSIPNNGLTYNSDSLHLFNTAYRHATELNEDKSENDDLVDREFALIKVNMTVVKDKGPLTLGFAMTFAPVLKTGAEAPKESKMYVYTYEQTFSGDKIDFGAEGFKTIGQPLNTTYTSETFIGGSYAETSPKDCAKDPIAPGHVMACLKQGSKIEFRADVVAVADMIIRNVALADRAGLKAFLGDDAILSEGTLNIEKSTDDKKSDGRLLSFKSIPEDSEDGKDAPKAHAIHWANDVSDPNTYVDIFQINPPSKGPVVKRDKTKTADGNPEGKKTQSASASSASGAGSNGNGGGGKPKNESCAAGEPSMLLLSLLGLLGGALRKQPGAAGSPRRS